MAQIFTGAKGVITIGDTTLAFASGINVNQENTLTDVDVIGKLEVGDLAETGHKINFSVNSFKAVVADNADTGDGVTTQTATSISIDSIITSEMRNQAYFNVEIFSEQTAVGEQISIYKMTDCKFEGGSGQLDARGVWNGTWNFRAKTGNGL